MVPFRALLVYKSQALGAAGVVKLGEQNLQVILGPLAEIIAGEMKALR